MKKTIISLLVLAGVAAAADVVSWDATAGDASLVASGTAVQDWTVNGSGLTWASGAQESLIVTLDVTNFSATTDSYTLLSVDDAKFNGLANVYIANGSLNVHLWNNSTPTTTLALTNLISDTTQTLTIVLSHKANNGVLLGVYADDVFTSAVADVVVQENGFNFSDTSFTNLYYGGNPGSITGNGESFIPDGAGAGTWTLLGAGYTAGSLVTTEQLSGYYAANVGTLVNPAAALTVPEPATATLSLLALCGLAARRRR